MARVIREYGVGVVTSDFSTHALAREIDALTPQRVAAYKSASAASARSLSAEEQVVGWKRAIDAIVRRGT